MNKAELFFATTDAIYDKFSNRRYPNASNIHKDSDRKYGEDPLQNFDIYYRKKSNAPSPVKEPKPVLINVHGGGFVGGEKKNRDYFCNLYADNGWFVINTNYRLCPKVQLHDQICDIYSVLSAVPTLKHIYDIDDKKVVMTGDSAGAYLCGYMEAILTNPMLQHRLKLPKIETELSGLMLYSGVYDLSKLLSQKILLNMAKCIGESITNIKTKNINDIKKYKYFDAISLPQFVNKKWCPTMLSYSANDVFTKGQGEDMQSLLFANDIPVYTHTTNTFFDNHNYQLSFSATAKEALLKSLEFLEKIKENHHKKSKCIINPYIENILNK